MTEEHKIEYVDVRDVPPGSGGSIGGPKTYSQYWSPVSQAVDNNWIVGQFQSGDTRAFMIPNDKNNRDWQDYLYWKALGNSPSPPATRTPPPPPVDLQAQIDELKAEISALKEKKGFFSRS